MISFISNHPGKSIAKISYNLNCNYYCPIKLVTGNMMGHNALTIWHALWSFQKISFHLFFLRTYHYNCSAICGNYKCHSYLCGYNK